MNAQLAAQRAPIEQMEGLVTLRFERVERLKVRAEMDGVLHVMDVEVGQLVAPGDQLARVSGHTHVKAELKIPETRVNDFTMGPLAEDDTRNGVTRGDVTRVDPSATE